MALRDQPYLPLYVQDYLTDEKLSMCSWATQGIYIKILCLLHKSDPYGMILLKQNDKREKYFASDFAVKIARLLPIDFDILSNAISELVQEDVLKIDGNKLLQKRMVRDNEISIMRAGIGSKGGKTTQKFAKAKCKANNEYEYKAETYIDLLNKVLEKNQIKISDKFRELIVQWLKYKSEKHQSYKETGLKNFITKTIADTKGSESELEAMIIYSTSKNYDGLFKEKQYAGNSPTNSRNVKRTNQYWDKEVSVPSIQNGLRTEGNK